jgi:hypothetical protein
VLRRLFGPEEGEVTEGGDECMRRSIIICAPHRILLG